LRRQMPNLQSIRAVVNGKPQRVLVCTRCLRTGKVQKRLVVPKAKPAAPAAPSVETAPTPVVS
jgi:ribosomal protein L28